MTAKKTAKKTAPTKDGGSQDQAQASTATEPKKDPFAGLPPKLAADMRTAIRVSKQKRAAAPDIAAKMGPVGDALTRRAKMCVDKGLVPKGFHTHWGEIKDHNLNISSGFVPVVDDNQQVQHAELELYMIDNKITEADDAVQLARSQAQMRQPVAEQKERMKKIPEAMIPAEVAGTATG